MQSSAQQQDRDPLYYIIHRAPLATFDTVDLGDEDGGLNTKSLTPSPSPAASPAHSGGPAAGGVAAQRPASLGPKIGGAHSKGKGPAHKPGSDPGGQQDPGLVQAAADQEDAQTPVSSQPQQTPVQDNICSKPGTDDDTPTPTNPGPSFAPDDLTHTCSDRVDGAAVGSIEIEAAGESSTDLPLKRSKEDCAERAEASGAPSTQKPQAPIQPPPVPPRTSCPPPPPRIGKIVGSWAHPPDSDSFSSSSDSCSETITFRPIKGLGSASAPQDDDDDDDDETDLTPQTRRRLILHEKNNDFSLNLYPVDLDPSQIASPSKRKAYEKRLLRLQVKTSPRVRPRSTTPINVVTLDEYVLSSPEAAPTTPLQEKLKICLPSSDFSTKHKSHHHSHRQHSQQRHHQDEAAFTFNEEILFSRTRSALVVDEVGQVPPSPRRVLIPPTLSPSTSPKLTRAAVPNSDSSPQLVYIKGETVEQKRERETQNKELDDIFGQPAQPGETDNWATFPDEPDTAEQYDSSADEEDEAGERALNSSDESEPAGSSEAESEDFEAQLRADSPEVDEEFITVSIQPTEPCQAANIEVVLSAASSGLQTPSTPDSDEAIKQAAEALVGDPPPVLSKSLTPTEGPPTIQPPPIPPRRRPPPPPPPPPPDVVAGVEGSDAVAVKCDLLQDINSQ